MSNGQFGFLVGVLLVWLIWATSFWVALGAAVAGVIGYAVARLLEDDVEFAELTQRLFAARR